ncbi:phage tail length tape measure family protein [Phytoactinopolyspora mesophila]|uniref:Bacteriophage tail tape measure N-terminal domain-containing protein n=1 Tax=Phytoactinopolyspora mesophila TaxID=2650750 RepID=A0A7K3M5Q4_9ACTN|nr:phage tail length tape measure family protein [Phytoactinopolyspora mesophila]NDL58643.1 hypothetical protein [Phytoactinopolyspora mesophila]
MSEVVGSASVEVSLDSSAAQQELQAFSRRLSDAFSRLSDQAASELSNIGSSADFSGISDAAEQAASDAEAAVSGLANTVESEVSGIDGDFSGISASAEQAASEAESAIDSMVGAVESDVSGIDGDFSGISSGAESAASQSEDAFAGVSSAIESDLSGIDADFSSVQSSAESAAAGTQAAFDGVGGDISSEFDEADDGARSLEGSVTRLVAAFATMATIRSAVSTVEAINTEMALLENQLENTGNQLGLVSGEMEQFAQSASLEFGIDVSELIDAQATIASFAGDVDIDFTRMRELSIDLAAEMGRSIPDAARDLGRALEDPEAAFRRLERQNIFLDDATKDLVQSLAEAGDTAGAQAALFEALEQRVGGAGAASADSTDRIRQSFQALLTDLGGPLVSVIDDNIDKIQDLIAAASPLAETLGEVAGVSLQAFLALAPAIEAVADVIGHIPSEVLAAAAGFVALQRAARGAAGALNLLRAHPAIAALSAIALGLGAISKLGSDASAEMHEVDRALSEIAGTGGQAATDLMGRLDDRINAVDDSSKILFVRWNDDPFSGWTDQGGNLETVLGDINDGIVRLAATDLDAAEAAFEAVQESVAGAGDEVQEMAEEHLSQAEYALDQARAAAEETANAINDFGQSTEEAGQKLAAFDVSGTGQDFLAFAEILEESEHAAEDFEAAAQRLGVSVETLENAVPGVQAEFESFSSTLQSSIPGIDDVVSRSFENMTQRFDGFFDKLNELEPGSEAWVAEVQRMAEENDTFADNLSGLEVGSQEWIEAVQRMNEAGGALDLSDISDAIFGVQQDAEDFVSNMDTIVSTGMTGLAQLAAESPEIAAIIAANIDDDEALAEMEAGLQKINDLNRNAMLEMAAEQALVSHAVGEAMRTGTLEPLNLLPGDIRDNVMPSVAEALGVSEPLENAAGSSAELASGSFISRFLSGIQDGQPSLVNQAVDSTGAAVDGATSKATEAIGAGTVLMDSEASGIRAGQSGTQSVMVGATGDIIGAGEQAAAAATVVGMAVTAAFAQGMSRTTRLVTVVARGLTLEVIEAAQQAAAFANVAGSALTGAFAEGIAARARMAATAGRLVASSAISAAAGSTSGAYSVGQAISSGIASGISAGVGRIISAAVAAVRAALAAARAAASIASPSKLFNDDVGLPISEGIAEGILAGERDIIDATKRVVDSASRAARDNVKLLDIEEFTDRELSALKRGDVDAYLELIARGIPDSMSDQAALNYLATERARAEKFMREVLGIDIFRRYASSMSASGDVLESARRIADTAAREMQSELDLRADISASGRQIALSSSQSSSGPAFVASDSESMRPVTNNNNINVITPAQDPEIVAEKVMNRLVTSGR